MDLQLDFLKTEEIAALKLRGLFERHGYSKYKVSRFEEYALYLENQSFLTDKNVITFTDLDGKLLALKPDVTLSIVKNTAATADTREKLYYTENVYRVNKESHTFREINQMGLEYLGKADDAAAAEVVSLARESLEIINPRYVLALSHMGFVTGLIDEITSDPALRAQLLSYIGSRNLHALRQLCEANSLCAAPLEMLVSIYGAIGGSLAAARSLITNDAMQTAYDELVTAAAAGNSDSCLLLDFSIINDADYYNGVVFQGYIEGLPRMVVSGGRYDNIMHRFGKNARAIGFAVYLDELGRLSTEDKN